MAENINQKTDMPFFEHIEALRWHLVRSIVVVAVLGIVEKIRSVDCVCEIFDGLDDLWRELVFEVEFEIT